MEAIRSALVIFIGSGIGALVRWGIGLAWPVAKTNGFPLGTLVINILGCLLIGCFAGYFKTNRVPVVVHQTIMIGFLGGFTTFSSFGLETLNLLVTQRFAYASIYVLASNMVGIAFCGLGFALFSQTT